MMLECDVKHQKIVINLNNLRDQIEVIRLIGRVFL